MFPQASSVFCSAAIVLIVSWFKFSGNTFSNIFLNFVCSTRTKKTFPQEGLFVFCSNPRTDRPLSEEEAYAAEQRLGIAIRVERLAVEVLDSRVDVRERNVRSADFPALLVDMAVSRIIRRHNYSVVAEVTVSGISAPRTLVGNVRTLVGELDAVSRVVVVSFRVLSEGTEEIPLWSKR